ncbi:hypothetical protein OA2633_07594 [Oceanicaulis sp. HTCC2633]|nr:hypothetical protein OA2633_07594 [Oceanicaulis sp. HTCC2633]
MFLHPKNTDGFKQSQRANRICICSVFRCFEAYHDMALSSQVVNFVWLHLLDEPDQIR